MNDDFSHIGDGWKISDEELAEGERKAEEEQRRNERSVERLGLAALITVIGFREEIADALNRSLDHDNWLDRLLSKITTRLCYTSQGRAKKVINGKECIVVTEDFGRATPWGK